MAFLDFLFGRQSRTRTRPTYLPEQENLLNSILSGGQELIPQGIQNYQNILGGDQSFLDAFLAPSRRNFQQNTIPALTEQFGRFGTGLERSSGFQDAIGRAASDFETNLQSQRLGLQLPALQGLMGFLQPALGNRQSQYIEPRSPGLLEEALKAFASSFNPVSTGTNAVKAGTGLLNTIKGLFS